MEHESDGDTNCNWRTWTDRQRVEKSVGWVGNRRTNPDHPNYPALRLARLLRRVLGRLAVTRTLVKDHQVTLIEKLTGSIIIIMISRVCCLEIPGWRLSGHNRIWWIRNWSFVLVDNLPRWYHDKNNIIFANIHPLTLIYEMIYTDVERNISINGTWVVKSDGCVFDMLEV